jgi:predicted DNA-binding transcriptional regulator
VYTPLLRRTPKGILQMITLSEDEVAALKAILIALRAIKVREIDKALVILSRAERGGSY